MSQDFVRRLPGSGLQSRGSKLGEKIHLDLTMFILILGISAYGLVVLYSAVGQSLEPVISQSLKILVATVAMIIASQIGTL